MKRLLRKATKRMRSNKLLTLAILLTAYLFPLASKGQGIHFSQYYNAPLLLNPANTALMPTDDYQAGFNYRKQWATVPVPYQTISAYASLQAMRNKNETNWLGLGAAVFNDKAGDGVLSLSRYEGFVAYHVQLGLSAMISVGASVASVQRRVDYSKLTFGMQWEPERFGFNKTFANGEDANNERTKYTDIGAGVNFAFFPNEDVYLKIGIGMSHVNRPRESFYNQGNRISSRPNANIDLVFKINPAFILNPSIYYTTQRGATELICGTLGQFNVTSENSPTKTSLILGGYYRLNESLVGAVGMQMGGLRIMTSYDFTVSTLGSVNKGRGAMEFGITYSGVYGEGSRTRQSYGCPRF